jgi:hypothetical protein
VEKKKINAAAGTPSSAKLHPKHPYLAYILRPPKWVAAVHAPDRATLLRVKTHLGYPVQLASRQTGSRQLLRLGGSRRLPLGDMLRHSAVLLLPRRRPRVPADGARRPARVRHPADALYQLTSKSSYFSLARFLILDEQTRCTAAC